MMERKEHTPHANFTLLSNRAVSEHCNVLPTGGCPVQETLDIYLVSRLFVEVLHS